MIFLYFCNAKRRMKNTDNCILSAAVEALSGGSTLLYPTDTIWGIGCDATCADAVEKIYAIKRRDHSKSMLVLCADIAMVERFISPADDEIRSLLLDSTRPTTVILPLRQQLLAGNLAATDGTIGVRIPRMDFCQSLLCAFGKPIVSTSANLSGQPSPACYADISKEIKEAVDYCIPSIYEEQKDSRSSRIVKIDPDGSLAVLRP